MKISTQLNLNWKVLILKNLDPAKKKSCLDSKDNLYRFKKLISTYREVWISIGLDFWDPQAHKKTFFQVDWLIETFQSKLWPVKIFAKIVETHRDCQDLLRRIEICWDAARFFDIIETFWVWKWWKVLTDWEILTRKCKNPCTCRLRLRKTVVKRRNFQILMNYSISTKISLLSRHTFWRCWDFLDCKDWDTIETNQDP